MTKSNYLKTFVQIAGTRLMNGAANARTDIPTTTVVRIVAHVYTLKQMCVVMSAAVRVGTTGADGVPGISLKRDF